jgi:segregation and condensation protein B
MSLDLSSRLEALLFSEGGGPIQKKKIVQLLECSDAELGAAAAELAAKRAESGIALVATNTEIALLIAPAAKETIEKAQERELGREIGDAGLEVLAIILYRGPSTRSRIDYIRGVNTSSTIRSLTARGLIELIPNPEDAREYLYRPTSELLAHLGVRDLSELPDYGKISGELSAFEVSNGPFNESDHAAGDEQRD